MARSTAGLSFWGFRVFYSAQITALRMTLKTADLILCHITSGVIYWGGCCYSWKWLLLCAKKSV